MVHSTRTNFRKERSWWPSGYSRSLAFPAPAPIPARTSQVRQTSSQLQGIRPTSHSAFHRKNRPFAPRVRSFVAFRYPASDNVSIIPSSITALEGSRHVERKIGFFIHLTVYLMVNSVLILFNLLHHPGKLWAFGPLFGWGIGLLFHGAAVSPIPSAKWKQRMIDNELEKYRRTP